MNPRKHLLVVGAGSVGKRHLRNLAALGCELSAMDPRADRLDEAQRETPLVSRHAALDGALAAPAKYDGVIICSPPKFHVQQAIAALQAGLPVFLEKPVSPDLESAERLLAAARAADRPVVMGYTYRWWPPLFELKARLNAGEIGKVRHVHCVMSAHLADWHPWEAYTSFFMASRELGGGALLDESHFIDLMLWFFGTPSSISARVEKLSDLQIETDDNVDALMVYDGGPRVAIHLDLFGRPHEKYIRITGESGTLHWSFDPNEIRLGRAAEQRWEATSYQGERNDMFVAAIREFLEVLDGRPVGTGRCTLENGVEVMRVIEVMRRSSSEGRTLPMSA